MSCSHCPDAIHNTNRNDSAPLKKVKRNDFTKCEQHETQSRRVKIKFKILELRDIVVIANAHLGYYYQMFNAILQVNAIYFQRRKKLLTIINLMSNTRKTYKKKQILTRFWIRQAQTSLWWDKFLQDKVNWRENLRISKNSFYMICDLIAPFISKNTSYMRQPISPESHQILLVSEKVVSCIVKNVTEMICQHLGPKFIKLPLTNYGPVLLFYTP